MGIKKFASQNEKILISRSISESKILKLRKTEVCDSDLTPLHIPFVN